MKRLHLTLLAALVLCAPGSAFGGEEPAPGAAAHEPRWGFLLRAGTYGLPDFILDELFVEHPRVNGAVYGGELRYYGDGGPKGIFSIGLGVDVGSAQTDGVWRKHEEDDPSPASGELLVYAATLTAYWEIFPSWMVHPYVGLGLGGGFAKGQYETEDEIITARTAVPVPHLPVGLTLNLDPRLGFSAEARVIGGFSFGGAFSLRF